MAWYFGQKKSANVPQKSANVATVKQIVNTILELGPKKGYSVTFYLLTPFQTHKKSSLHLYYKNADKLILQILFSRYCKEKMEQDMKYITLEVHYGVMA